MTLSLHCPECGEKIDSDEEFCLSCGHIIHMREENHSPVMRPEPNFRWLILVLGATLALLFIAANYHPVMNRLFPPRPVTLAVNVDQATCDDIRLERPVDCSTTWGCRTACTDEFDGLCVRGELTPLDGMIRDGRCLCICGPP